MKVNLRDLTILAGIDGSAVALSCDLRNGPGDFSLDGIQENFSATNDIIENGVFVETTYGAEEAVTGSLTINHTDLLTDTVTGRPLDFVLRTGLYTSGTTVDPGGVVWRCDILFTVAKAGVSSTIRLNTCRLKATFGVAAEVNTISLSWEARGRPGRRPMELS